MTGFFRAAALLVFLGGVLALSSEAEGQSQSDPSRAATILVYDVSNSMWGRIDGRSKVEIAREVIGDLLQDWDPGVDLGLVAYGHRRAGDCGDIEEVIPIGPVDPGSFSTVVDGLVPRGKTPLTEAVRQAADILNYADRPATVILVSDGIESCNADPCALAQELERGGINFTAHVVGFDVARIEDQRQLSCLADETGGMYLTAQSAGELLSALRTVAAPPPPPPPVLRLEATMEAGGAVIDDPGLRWTVVALDREETILGGEAVARPELEVEGGRYFARAELGSRAGAIEFDYSGDTDALHQVVLAAAATLDAAPVVEAGSAFAVDWTGPDDQGDFVTIVPAGAKDHEAGNYAYTRGGAPAELTAQDAPGSYELRYVSGSSRTILARLLIEVTPVTASIEAPPAIGAGADITIAWQGPDNRNDFITIVPVGEAEGKHGNYTYTRKGNPLEVPAPDAPGSYELRYLAGQSKTTLARLPIAVTEATATLEAPPAIGAGADIEIAWQGPDNRNDFITVVPSGEAEGKHGNYTYTRKGNPLELRAPDASGSYELRYVTGQSKETLARLPITVIEATATLEAPPAIGAGADIEIAWQGPDNRNDFITIVPVGEAEGKHGNYTYTRKGNPLEVPAPDAPGSYELRYVTGQSKETLAALPITITAVSASLEAVPAANAGARVDVTWTGPDNRNDFITVVATGEKEGKHGNYTYTRKGNPLELLLPETPGSYEIRYLTAQSKETLARLPIAALPVTATLDAAPVVTAGGKVQVTWTGPDNHNDFIAIATPDQKNRQQVTYTYTRKGNPLEINAPKEPGRYELRYVTAQDKNVLARLPITVD
jgi:Ca-activated chloride channel family protein